MMKFFTYDHHGEGMEFHDTELEAKKYAQELLNSYIQNNDENNINICWGIVKQSVHANNEKYKFKTVKWKS